MATLTIFLHDKALQSLKRAVPRHSHSRSVLNEADRWNVHHPYLGNNVIRCDELRARNLLLYARNCPEAVAAIQTHSDTPDSP